jgi:hypothetical protein
MTILVERVTGPMDIGSKSLLINDASLDHIISRLPALGRRVIGLPLFTRL